MEPPDRSPQSPNEWGILAVIGFFFALFLVADLAMDFSAAKLSVPAYLISSVFLLLLHEAGHAAVARFLGWQVERVSIGVGRVRWSTRRFGIPVEFRTIPLSGFVTPRPVDLGFPRLKQFLIYAAGPGIELLAVFLCFASIGSERFFSRSADAGLIAAQAFAVAGVVSAFFNLIPLSHSVDGVRAWSDGLGMIRCWSISDEGFRRMRDGRDTAD